VKKELPHGKNYGMSWVKKQLPHRLFFAHHIGAPHPSHMFEIIDAIPVGVRLLVI
jgi:hypothetical protein